MNLRHHSVLAAFAKKLLEINTRARFDTNATLSEILSGAPCKAPQYDFYILGALQGAQKYFNRAVNLARMGSYLSSERLAKRPTALTQWH